MKPYLSMALFAISLAGTLHAHTETGFINRTVKVDGREYPYQVYVPRDWNKATKWPVILFLHGAGERGDNGTAQTEVGIGRAVRLRSEQVPAIVVMPQVPSGQWWAQPPMQAMAMAALESASKEFNGDRERLYLTGISMGGFGTWALAVSYPETFAALAPVCGGVTLRGRPEIGIPGASGYAAVAKKVGKTPAWIFHGAADPVVPVEGSREMENALRAIGGNVRYTEYPGVGHNSWDPAYAEPEFFQWMLAQKRIVSGF